MPTSIRFEYTRPGRGVTVYDEQLVLERDDVSVLLLESYTGPGYSVDGRLVLDAAAPMLWFLFPGSWASVARFHLASGTFTGWYTNLSTPVEKKGDLWSSTDLFLDLWTPATGRSQWLDEDDFRRAVASKLLDKQTAERVQQERERIEALLKRNEWPPQVCREMTMKQAARSSTR